MCNEVDSIVCSNSSTLFEFNSEHNGIQCARMLNAERACDRAWFSAKQLETWSEMSKTTLWRWLERLEKARRIASVSDMKQTSIPDSSGVPHETTFYNLNVLNQLAMACIDNEKLNEISSKFSDILSEVETTGSYSIQPAQQSAQPTTPQTYLEALKALVASEEAKQLALRECEAEKRKREIAEKGEEIAIKKMEWAQQEKIWIASKREATCMEEVKRSHRAVSAIEKKNCELYEENLKLKKQLDQRPWYTTRDLREEWIKRFGHKPSPKRLIDISKILGDGYSPRKFVKIETANNSWMINSYHVKAWKIYFQEENELLKITQN